MEEADILYALNYLMQTGTLLNMAEAAGREYAREQVRIDAEAEWEVVSVNGETASPGPGWEPFAAGETWILWRRRKQK